MRKIIPSKEQQRRYNEAQRQIKKWLKENRPKKKKKKVKKAKKKVDINKKYKNYIYTQLLQTPEWRRKRTEILIRDKYTCQKCRFKMNLEVHHTKYTHRLPWLTKNKYLITLCEICHAKEHGKI